MSLTAVIRLTGQRLELVRHPLDGHVIAFDHAEDAFAFAVSLELTGAASSAGTVDAPHGERVHLLAPGATAFDLDTQMELAA
jgi:hypothetical protein